MLFSCYNLLFFGKSPLALLFIVSVSYTHLIGPGVVVDPFVLLEEMDVLASKGICTDHIFISDRAHLLLPYHVRLDCLQEARDDTRKIGTTKRGIGPCLSLIHISCGL